MLVVNGYGAKVPYFDGNFREGSRFCPLRTLVEIWVNCEPVGKKNLHFILVARVGNYIFRSTRTSVTQGIRFHEFNIYIVSLCYSIYTSKSLMTRNSI